MLNLGKPSVDNFIRNTILQDLSDFVNFAQAAIGDEPANPHFTLIDLTRFF
jgi:hypothetical protein